MHPQTPHVGKHVLLPCLGGVEQCSRQSVRRVKQAFGCKQSQNCGIVATAQATSLGMVCFRG